jgi:hypothetical protein
MKMIYYFGDKYYNESGTMMSSLYTEKGERYDWGFLRRDVETGQDVVVRKATPDMIKWADEQLKTFKE